MAKFKLIDYFDVWYEGNDGDHPQEDDAGWQVNNLCTAIEEIEAPEDMGSEEIIDLLKKEGYLLPSVEYSDIDVWNEGGGFIELYMAKNGCPMGRLELIQD